MGSPLALIYDASGKMVYQKFVGNSQGIIDVKDFSAGIYFIRIGLTESKKFNKIIIFGAEDTAWGVFNRNNKLISLQ